MKKSLVAAGLSLAFCASTAFAAEPPTKEESWTGIIKKTGTEATFEANGKTYPIEGKQEAELLKHDGQKVTVTGWMKKDATTGKESIDVARFAPAGTTGSTTSHTTSSTH